METIVKGRRDQRQMMWTSYGEYRRRRPCGALGEGGSRLVLINEPAQCRGLALTPITLQGT